MNILITGGCGFVGSSLAIFLKQNHPNAHIITLDNLKRRGSEINLDRLKKFGIEFKHGDVRVREDLEQVNSPDWIIECSAEPSVLAGYNSSPHYVIQSNLNGMANCLELARVHRSHFIFLSSSRVYPMTQIDKINLKEGETRFTFSSTQTLSGVSEKGITEDFPLQGIRSLYGATKLCGEYLMQEYLALYGLKGVINRCGVLAGPWQMGKADQGFVPLWLARHIYGGELSYIGYNGTGKQMRDILHIDDLCELIDIQMQSIETMSGECYNVGGGIENTLSLCELTALCNEVTGNNIKINQVKAKRDGDICCYITDNSKIKNKTKWHPKKSPKMTVTEISEWIRDHKNTLQGVFNP